LTGPRLWVWYLFYGNHDHRPLPTSCLRSVAREVGGTYLLCTVWPARSPQQLFNPLIRSCTLPHASCHIWTWLSFISLHCGGADLVRLVIVVVRILFASSLWWCGSCSPRHRGGANCVHVVVLWWCSCRSAHVIVVWWCGGSRSHLGTVISAWRSPGAAEQWTSTGWKGLGPRCQ
jgi:hypothetical protein